MRCCHRHPPLVRLWPPKPGGNARKLRNSNNGCHSPFSFPPLHHPLYRYHIIDYPPPRLRLGEKYMPAPGIPRCLNENCLTLITNPNSLVRSIATLPTPTREQGHRHPLPNGALARNVPVRPPTIPLNNHIYRSFSAYMECRNLTSHSLLPHAKRCSLARTRTAKYAWMEGYGRLKKEKKKKRPTRKARIEPGQLII